MAIIPFLQAVTLVIFLIGAIIAIIFSLLWLKSLIQTKIPNISTKKHVAKAMVKLADLKKDDKVVDLGCGTGNILNEARKHTKNILGYEKDPLGRLICAMRRIKVKNKDFYTANLQNTDVIFTYLFGFAMKKIEKKVVPQLKKGTKLVSHGFPLPNTPYQKKIKLKTNETIYLYIF